MEKDLGNINLAYAKILSKKLEQNLSSIELRSLILNVIEYLEKTGHKFNEYNHIVDDYIKLP